MEEQKIVGLSLAVIKNGKPIVRSYYSYTFKKSELKWLILRKEAFAIHKAMKKFRKMLKWHTSGMVEIRCNNYGSSWVGYLDHGSKFGALIIIKHL